MVKLRTPSKPESEMKVLVLWAYKASNPQPHSSPPRDGTRENGPSNKGFPIRSQASLGNHYFLTLGLYPAVKIWPLELPSQGWQVAEFLAWVGRF